MGPNCMETYIRLYGFLPVWFGWKGNPGLERMGEVEMGRGCLLNAAPGERSSPQTRGRFFCPDTKGAWYIVPRPFSSTSKQKRQGDGSFALYLSPVAGHFLYR